MDEAVLEFRRIRLTRENIQPNIGCLRDKVRIRRVGEYFKLARNYLHGKVRIGCVGEYFKLVRNYLRGKVQIRRVGEYLNQYAIIYIIRYRLGAQESILNQHAIVKSRRYIIKMLLFIAVGGQIAKRVFYLLGPTRCQIVEETIKYCNQTPVIYKDITYLNQKIRTSRP